MQWCYRSPHSQMGFQANTSPKAINENKIQTYSLGGFALDTACSRIFQEKFVSYKINQNFPKHVSRPEKKGVLHAECPLIVEELLTN